MKSRPEGAQRLQPCRAAWLLQPWCPTRPHACEAAADAPILAFPPTPPGAAHRFRCPLPRWSRASFLSSPSPGHHELSSPTSPSHLAQPSWVSSASQSPDHQTAGAACVLAWEEAGQRMTRPRHPFAFLPSRPLTARCSPSASCFPSRIRVIARCHHLRAEHARMHMSAKVV